MSESSPKVKPQGRLAMPDAIASVVSVLPEKGREDKIFDYLVPAGMSIVVGDRVRVPLASRNVPGWVVAVDVRPPAGVTLKEIAACRGMGPSSELVELSSWAAWRWAGSRRAFLQAASPTRIVQRDTVFAGRNTAARTKAQTEAPQMAPQTAGSSTQQLDQAWHQKRSIVRLGPAADPWPWVCGFIEKTLQNRTTLVLAPSQMLLDYLQRKALSAGMDVFRMPDAWGEAANVERSDRPLGSMPPTVVLGSRAAAWAPAPNLGSVVVLDIHDESWTETRSPTWNAVEVSLERAARSDAHWLGLSCCPSVSMESIASVIVTSRSDERQAWSVVEVVDLNEQDPRLGLISEQATRLFREATEQAPAVCVFNRKGRAKLLACQNCREIMRCEACGAALGQQLEGDELVCPLCSLRRPVVCAHCSSVKLRLLRPGVTRLVEEIAAISGKSVVELTASSDERYLPACVIVGTEAALHRVPVASSVIFLDFDQELLSPHYRASEAALALLGRASRLLRGRRRGGRILVQSRLVSHEVIDAAMHADPTRLSFSERERRSMLGLPPFSALATVSGSTAAPWIEGVSSTAVLCAQVQEDKWLLRAPNHHELCSALSLLGRAPKGVRVEVDPLRA